MTLRLLWPIVDVVVVTFARSPRSEGGLQKLCREILTGYIYIDIIGCAFSSEDNMKTTERTSEGICSRLKDLEAPVADWKTLRRR